MLQRWYTLLGQLRSNMHTKTCGLEMSDLDWAELGYNPQAALLV